MTILNKLSLTFGAMLLSSIAFAQNPMINDQAQSAPQQEAVNQIWQPSLVRDGVIDKVAHEREVTDWAPIREIDVSWKRRVWRKIDTRQKQNDAFRYRGDENTGGGAFIEILNDAILKGKITAYNPVDDRFTTPLDIPTFQEMLIGTADSTRQIDPMTGEEVWTFNRNEFNINTVTKYTIKEDWIFDRNIGRLVVRIVGIAPMVDRYDENTGDFKYTTELYWLYYPELRRVLVNYEVYNAKNDLHRMTWTDYFDNRYFNSYVVKTSADNPRGISLPENSLRGLQEGKNVMKNIQDMEMNMWVD